MRRLNGRWYLLIVPVAIPVILFYLHLTQYLYSQPANLKQVINLAKEATFEIKCDQDWVGAGWAIESTGLATSLPHTTLSRIALTANSSEQEMINLAFSALNLLGQMALFGMVARPI